MLISNIIIYSQYFDFYIGYLLKLLGPIYCDVLNKCRDDVRLFTPTL